MEIHDLQLKFRDECADFQLLGSRYLIDPDVKCAQLVICDKLCERHQYVIGKVQLALARGNLVSCFQESLSLFGS